MLSTVKTPTPEKNQDKVEDTTTISGKNQDEVEDTSSTCYAAGNESPRIELASERTNLREFLCLIRQAEVIVELERMTRDRDEAISKRQRKKLDKKIRKKRARCSASNILNQILTEERGRKKRKDLERKATIPRKKWQTRKPHWTGKDDRDRQQGKTNWTGHMPIPNMLNLGKTQTVRIKTDRKIGNTKKSVENSWRTL